jgi:hypothetical protein
VTIEDDTAVLVTHDSGATTTYHLTAYSPAEDIGSCSTARPAGTECRRVDIHSTPSTRRVREKGWVHGDVAAPAAGRTTITLRPLWQPFEDHTVDHDHTGYGRADVLTLQLITGDQNSDHL